MKNLTTGKKSADKNKFDKNALTPILSLKNFADWRNYGRINQKSG